MTSKWCRAASTVSAVSAPRPVQTLAISRLWRTNSGRSAARKAAAVHRDGKPPPSGMWGAMA
ncbi:MAG: hypothetical protein U1E40_01460 [Amaricoccus sp.]